MKYGCQLQLNFDDPVEYLSLPAYHHAPLHVGYHEIPIRGCEVRVVVSTGSHGHFLTITVEKRSA